MPEPTVMTMRELHTRLEQLGKEDAENWNKFIWTVDPTRNYRPLMNEVSTITASPLLVNDQGLIRLEISSSINQ